MKLLSKLARVFSYGHHLREVSAIKADQRKLDQGLERVMKATLNGESEWFIKEVSKRVDDPECVIRVIKECGGRSK